MTEPQLPEPESNNRHFFATLRYLLYAAIFIVACFSAASFMIWQTLNPDYTATAILHVKSENQKIIFQTSDTQGDSTVHRKTQVQLLRSSLVIRAALRDPAVRGLKIVQRQRDPVHWLSRNLEVNFPGSGEIMTVSMTLKDGPAAAKLVNAVVDAYMKEVVGEEQRQRKDRLDQLEALFSEQEERIRKKRAQLKELINAWEGDVVRDIQSRQQGLLEYRQELIRIGFERHKLQAELAAKEAVLKSEGQSQQKQQDLQQALVSDPVRVQLKASIESLDHVLRVLDTVEQAQVAEQVQKLQEVRKEFENQIKARENEVRRMLQESREATLAADIERLKLDIAIRDQQEELLGQEIDKIEKQITGIAGSFVDVDMLRQEIEQLEKILGTMRAELERMRIEMKIQGRVKLLKRAEVPQARDTFFGFRL